MSKIFKIIALSLILGASASGAEAAVLYFSPSSSASEVGGAFSVAVYVSSKDQAMNAASGVVSFPQDKLEVTSLSKSGSIISLWIPEPSFSNGDGTVRFDGIVLNPGFTGASGRILTMRFRVKAAGTAPVSFSSGSVLANDGGGTNILTESGSAQFDLRARPSAPKTTAPAATPPAAPVTPVPPRFSPPPPEGPPPSSLPIEARKTLRKDGAPPRIGDRQAAFFAAAVSCAAFIAASLFAMRRGKRRIP